MVRESLSLREAHVSGSGGGGGGGGGGQRSFALEGHISAARARGEVGREGRYREVGREGRYREGKANTKQTKVIKPVIGRRLKSVSACLVLVTG